MKGIVLCFVLVKIVIHVWLIEKFGLHSDELYFIECARNLAPGYVDHGPVVVWIAWLAGQISGFSALSLRLPSVLAGAATIWVTLNLVREFGGGKRALTITGVALILAPAYLRMNKMLHIPPFEALLWTMLAFLAVRIVKEPPSDSGNRKWLALGLLLGLALLTKVTVIAWSLGFLIGLAWARQLRWRDPYLYAGSLIAMALFGLNLYWQFANSWPTFEFIQELRDSTLAKVPRLLFLLAQILYIGPFALPIWLGGLVWLSVVDQGRFRFLAVSFFFAMLVFLVTRAKPYYAAAAYPVLLAAGGVFWEKTWLLKGRGPRIGLAIPAVVLAGLGAVFAVLSLPILPLPTLNHAIGRILGGVVNPRDLTFDLHLEYGWRELAHHAAGEVAKLSAAERRELALVSRSYSGAAAINFYGKGLRAHSPHMNFYLWGPPPDSARLVLMYGYNQAELLPICDSVEFAGRSFHELALPKLQEGAFFICRNLRPSWKKLWPAMKRYSFVSDMLVLE